MSSSKGICKNRIILFQSLVELMRDKPFESIIVDEITEKSMLSRGTFYRYVADKNDLLSFGISYYSGEAIKEMGIPESWESGSIFRIINVFFHYLEKRKRMLESLLGPHAPAFVHQQIMEIVVNYIKNCIFYVYSEKSVPFAQQFLSSLIAKIIMGSIKEWPTLSLKQRDYMVKCFCNFVSQGLSGFVNLHPTFGQ